MKVGVVVPVYNERENLPALVQALEVLRREVPWDLQLCVVEDNSPDGTGELADALAQQRPWMQVVHRPYKMGVASAYWVGFRRLLAQGAERLLQMDADFSHHPRYLAPLVAASAHYDIVIGSRYLPGSGLAGWPWRRRALSRLGNTFARWVLGVPVRDFTSGFKVYRRQVVEAMLRRRFAARGFAFQMETVYWAWRAGYRIGEIPIVFYERRAGRSKLDGAIFWEALRTVLWLRWHGWKEATG